MFFFQWFCDGKFSAEEAQMKINHSAIISTKQNKTLSILNNNFVDKHQVIAR